MILTLIAAPLVIWDFGSGPGDLVPYGDADQWEWGFAVDPPVTSDAVWGTNLSGPYLNDSVDHLELPPVDLSDAMRPTLVFRHWHRILGGDHGTIEVDSGSGWQRVEPIYGYPLAAGFVGMQGWTTRSVDLSPFGPTPSIRFRFSANASFADRGWYLEHVAIWDGDVTPPLVEPLDLPDDTQDLDGPYVVRVEVDDDTAVDEVTLRWSTGTDHALAMTELGGGVWQGEIPGQVQGTTVRWSVEASDEVGNAGTWPPQGEREFRVYLAAPTDLTVVGGDRPVGTVAVLTWTPPVSPRDVVGYQVSDVDGLREPIVVTGPTAEVPLAVDDPRTWHVAALYDVGLGDVSEPVTLGLEVPALHEVEPEVVLPGETRHIRLTGASLYLYAGVSTLDLGAGIDVDGVNVRDANTLEAIATVSGSAQPGLRAITVTGAHGAATFPDALTVLDRDDAPRLLSVTPDTLRQGYTERVTVVASAPFAGPVTVEHGAGLVLQGEPAVDGDTVRFDLAVRADTPVGPHSLILDDGVRRFATEIEVTRRVYRGKRRCEVAGGVATPWLWLVVAAAARRRRTPRQEAR